MTIDEGLALAVRAGADRVLIRAPAADESLSSTTAGRGAGGGGQATAG